MDPPPDPLHSSPPSVGALSAEFAKQKRAKSPPLAFEPTPNDALAARIPQSNSHSNITSPPRASSDMGPPQASHDPQQLQIVIDQQAAALQMFHNAHAAEREAWYSERDRLYARIASLEKLLRAREGHRYESSLFRDGISPKLTQGSIARPSRLSSPRATLAVLLLHRRLEL
jgi:hypothetical protein